MSEAHTDPEADLDETEEEVADAERHQDLDAGGIAWIIAIGVLFFVVLIIFLQVVYLTHENALLADRVSKQVNEKAVATLAAQREKQIGYRWIEQAKGRVGIPIERAMELVVKEQTAAQAAGGQGGGGVR